MNKSKNANINVLESIDVNNKNAIEKINIDNNIGNIGFMKQATRATFHNLSKIYWLIGILFVPIMLSGCDWILFNPKGAVGEYEKQLLIIATCLMLIVVIPVIFMTIFFAWKYRASNKNATYKPNWEHNTWIEVVVWTIPCIIILILAIITWKSTHDLDPYKKLDVKTDHQPINVQVIALDWKWLFIYPDYNIATINFLQFPVDTPINFKVTADAPMNSFMIPQLGGQIYAMAGMQTKLHLIANTVGDYNGMAVSYSGHGFSGMNFITRVSSHEEFNDWINTVKQSTNHLTVDQYKQLIVPSYNNKPVLYATVKDKLFDNVMMKFMMPGMENLDCHDNK